MKTETTILTAARVNFPRPSRETMPLAQTDLAAFSRGRSLEMALAETPDVRAEAVARGRALIANPNYPSKAQMKHLARRLIASGLAH
jgi:2,4-dienoyl-CoA reductase-like NADH-dependent reductase (Old Yellow Enzyme family)